MNLGKKVAILSLLTFGGCSLTQLVEPTKIKSNEIKPEGLKPMISIYRKHGKHKKIIKIEKKEFEHPKLIITTKFLKGRVTIEDWDHYNDGKIEKRFITQKFPDGSWIQEIYADGEMESREIYYPDGLMVLEELGVNGKIKRSYFRNKSLNPPFKY